MKLQMLHAAANRFGNFLRICCCQNKDHLLWWLFQSFQQRCFCTTGEHVHFIQNKDAMTTRACESSGFDDVANFLDTVVAGGVQFENVVTGARFHCFARVADAAWFAFKGVLAVENFGQNTSGGGLSCASRA